MARPATRVTLQEVVPMGCSVASRCCAFTLAMALVSVFGLSAVMPAHAEEGLSFDRDIRPLLSENCYACHGPGEQEAGLRLDTAEAASA
jgi:mono/diheme cytochrome c family protein